ncbi:cysteine desulfurase family protein [Tumebacillus flagellatus]|uniref:cysteine desulfurase n=1 Tax=Tumebacillus flagellatus TaxID=1157490 RepID=A0A074LVX0_9BACL|nr:cysteine desulfurase family protein [Tumebacillus flagellatus]KEO84705.1 cysteine desulfurase [Tumebacillus flagellatus]
MIYFDNSATTPLHPEVREAMLPYLFEIFGNPSGKYYTQAEQAKKAVENARVHVATLLGCDPEEIIFTSGATESNNMILKGFADYYQAESPHIVITKVEHPSILETARYLAQKGYQVTFLDVDKFGRANVQQLENVLPHEPSTPVLVSVLWGNNEVGSLNDIATFAKLCTVRKGVEEDRPVFFHTDATQVVGKVKTDVHQIGIDFLSCSSHKLHGPKGIGAAVIKKHRLGYRPKLTPLLHGGEQEDGYRSGTLSVHNIVGFGKAAEIAYLELQKTKSTLKELEDYLIDRIVTMFPDIVRLNSDIQNKIPGLINLQFVGIKNEKLIRQLSNHVAVSTGSACSSSKPSHVLQSMGLSIDSIRFSIRISLSTFNTKDEIDHFLSLLNS